MMEQVALWLTALGVLAILIIIIVVGKIVVDEFSRGDFPS
jgi:hypothetical protein